MKVSSLPPLASRDIGSATANDLPHGDPPDLLLDPWLHPEETTIIYGPGGVGKGITAAWLVQRLVAAKHVVMVIDFEHHPREWGSRFDGLQMYPHEKDNVHYRAPFGPDWTAKTGTLIEVWDLVREDIERLGVTYVVVDSYTPATGDDDRMGGQGAAQQFARAASQIGRPMLVLAHVASTAGRFPDKPFGSIHVRNLVARRQWAVESNGETEAHVPTDPSVIRLEFRNTKGNDYARAKPRHVSISFWPLGLIEVSEQEEAKPSVEFLIDAVLDQPMPIPAIRAAIKEDFRENDPPTEGVIDMTLRRHPEKYAIDKTGKRPYPWSKVAVAEDAPVHESNNTSP
jgi:hypothetical protein